MCEGLNDCSLFIAENKGQWNYWRAAENQRTKALLVERGKHRNKGVIVEQRESKEGKVLL